MAASSLPSFQTDSKDLQLLQNRWSTIINPVLLLPQNSSIILTNIHLSVGDNIIPHKLNRNLLGWQTCRLRAWSQIYDKQDSNPNPEIFLYLNSSADTHIDLVVF